MTERLVKVIARSGEASRRKAGELVKAGEVTINGKVTDNPGLAVDPEKDHVKVRGKLITPLPPVVYVLLHKPAGYICTRSDPQGRPTVMDLLKRVKAPVFPVGRLDRETEGLLLLTNDGDIAQRLLHPRYRARRVYHVQVKGAISHEALRSLRKGVTLRDGPAKPDVVNVVGHGDGFTRLRIIVTEGRNRLVRRMLDAVGHPVERLVRERFGPIDLGGLQRGKIRYLNEAEIAALRKLVRE